MITFFYYLGVIAKFLSGKGQCIIARVQKRIENLIKRLKWIFSRKHLSIFSCYLLLRKAPSKMFDRILNTPLDYAHFVYIV